MRGPYIQSSFADARPSAWDRFLFIWLRAGIDAMRRAGFQDLWLHDEIVFVARVKTYK